MKASRIVPLFLGSLGLALAGGCADEPNPDGAPVTEDSAEAAAVPEGWQLVGGGVPAGEVVPVGTLLADPAAFDGKSLVTEGQIETVCKKKGCWLTMVDGERSMRVRFKDYAIFVPTDSEGRTVRLEGIFQVKTVPVDEARHYLEDAGEHEKAAALEGDQVELSFEASGVLMRAA